MANGEWQIAAGGREDAQSVWTWLEGLPKVELHLHLEGAIPLETLWQLMQKYGGDPAVPTPDALRERFRFRDFPHFIETWIWKNQFLREYADFAQIAEAVARDLARQNVLYAEVFFSPTDFARQGLTPQGLAEAIRDGLERVPAIEIALIADLVRDGGPERAARTLEAIAEVRSQGIVGIGLGGSEQAYPPEPFAEVYARARVLGFRTTAHAGEAAGAASVWGALRDLRVDRIGHGTRAEEDPALLDYLAERDIPLELCPLSNVRTGVVPDVAQHPARRYFDRGLRVTVNTDDPQMFGNSLAEEYLALMTALAFTPAEILTLVRNGIEAAWLAPEAKARLRREVEDAVAGEPDADWIPGIHYSAANA